MALSSDDLARLLAEAHGGSGYSYSLRAALALVDGQPSPRVAALVARLTASKRAVWARISQATGTRMPPEDAGLTRLAEWEGEAVQLLTLEGLGVRLESGETVEEALLGHVREVVWTAGMIAVYGERVRMA